MLCPCPVPASDKQGGNEQRREQVCEDQVTARCQDPGTLAESRTLVLPVVEGRRTDHQVERLVGIWQLLRDSLGKMSRGSFAIDFAVAIIPAAASIPISLSASGSRAARSRKRNPVPQPTSSTRRGASLEVSARSAVRAAMS